MNAMKLWGLSSLSLWLGVGQLIGADAARPVNLKPFLRTNQFQTVGADWVLPRGRQVVEGVPFQVDGIVEVAGASARFSNVGRTNVNDIPIHATFERLYLLAAASRDVNEGVAIARLNLRYADGSRIDLPIEYGRHVGDWMGHRHKGESPLIEPDARVAWQVEHPAAARRDDSLRLFYLSLANPNPDKEVVSLSIISARARGGFMVAAMTTGPERVERQPDTLFRTEEHFHLEGAPGEKPALTGKITNSKGEPITNGIIRVVSVKTVDTTDKPTPEDSAFVGRVATTDATGNYRLANLSERLLYRILIASPESQALIFDGADPLAGTANARLGSGSGEQSGSYLVHARLVGPDGQPVVGASVKPDGVGTGTGTSWGGNMGFPTEVVTGLNGEFIMSRDQLFTRMGVDIKASGLAPAKVWLPVSNGVQIVQLGVGAGFTGRVLKGTDPMADVEVGVSGRDRSSEVYVGHYEVKTDAEGRFRFEHLPPDKDWYFYGLMRSLRRDGSLPPRQVKTAEHGKSSDLGDLQVEPGITLAGQVKSKDGQPLPPNLRLSLSYDSAWDTQTIRVDRDGYFEVDGLHRGQVQIYSSTRDWQPSGDNRSLDDWNPWSLMGLLEQDKHDLLLVLEKKERNYNSYWSGNGQLPERDQARNRPLSGAEESGPPWVYLGGTIVDDDSGNPVLKVRVTPGRKPPSTTAGNGGLLQTLIEAVRSRPIPWNERIFWEPGRVITVEEGRFFIANRQLQSLPLLRFEADGYNVFETAPTANSDTNLVIRLKKGNGPKGILALPDGQPAADVTVIFAAEQEQFSVNQTGAVYTYGQQQERNVVQSKVDGSFAFPSRAGGRRVFAGNPIGWAEAGVDDWPKDGRLTLQPWGQVMGILLDAGGKPATNIRLVLQLNWQRQDGDPWVNFQEQPETDKEGRFVFRKVPPGLINVVRLVPMSANSWTHAPQTNIVVKPGATIDLGRMTMKASPF
jgi:hypothetical protein